VNDTPIRPLPRLLERVRALDRWLRAEKRARWKRDLPLGELLSDRWQRAKDLGFGEGASIYHDAYVFGDVTVGDHTWIGPNTLLDGSGGGLTIGRFCSISAGVQIYTHDSVKWALSGGQAKYEHAPVSIGDNCYIGPYAVIARGVTIGSRAVVGACAFVNRDVPERTVVAGVPARVIGQVAGDGSDVRIVHEPGR
jgi:acetyltransferase-like isoleucine patch superfamily enzyme